MKLEGHEAAHLLVRICHQCCQCFMNMRCIPADVALHEIFMHMCCIPADVALHEIFMHMCCIPADDALHETFMHMCCVPADVAFDESLMHILCVAKPYTLSRTEHQCYAMPTSGGKVMVHYASAFALRHVAALILACACAFCRLLA